MNVKNLLASKTNLAAIVSAGIGILSACGVSLPAQWEDIAVKTAVALFALGVTIAGRIQAGARAPEATSIFGLVIQTADSLTSMLADAAASVPAAPLAATPVDNSGAPSSPESTGALTAPASNAGLATTLQTPGSVASEAAPNA